MRTNTFIKALAFAMLLATACNKNEIANDENTEKKGFALPVTVNVTREGDDATKATYDEGTGKLSFSAGDKLFVEGSHIEADRFAGTLTWQSGGTFSGTIYTESPYEGTIDDLLNGNYATLLPAGYESYDYLEIIEDENEYEAHLGENAYNSFATSKKLAVEQLSFEHGEYTSGTGFVLEPRNAILNFTITGLTASTNVTATLSDDDDWTPDIEGEVTTNESGTATFAIGLEGSSDLNEFSLSVAGNAITLVTESKTLAAGKIYNITRGTGATVNLSTKSTAYAASNGETLTGTLASNVKISIADGATVILNNVNINGTNSSIYNYAGITCEGDATIILSGTNSVKGFYSYYPGIYVPENKTVTIQGSGSLNASSNGSGAGIGGGIGFDCGNITITGGNITATGGNGRPGIGGGTEACGDITITGGTITATGGNAAAGIGGSNTGSCGDITITSGVTRVTATKGNNYSPNSIGAGAYGTCGTVKFGNQTMYNGSSWTTTPTSGSTYGGLSLTISQTKNANDTWTLTPVLP